MTPRTHPRRRRVAGVGVLLAGCLLLVGCQAADQAGWYEPARDRGRRVRR
jgi:hypothetical protein